MALSPKQRAKIRRALRRGMQPLEIARKFGVTLLSVAAVLCLPSPDSVQDITSRMT
jgi:hypothetical protein